MTEKLLTKRRYKDGDNTHRPWMEEIFEADASYKCPTYVHRTPPCQGSCPSGEDIRGWLNIVRGIEKPPEGKDWQEYAFNRVTDANPFPAIMGRVCPAPCEDGCNRNEVEEHVGINAVEQFIGDFALEHDLKLPEAGADTGKKVAVIGAGVAGLACAYHLRRKGHACTVFEAHEKTGGMMRYGIPGYRVPDEVLDGEIQRILDMGVELRLNTKIGEDITFDDLRNDFDAVFIALGAQNGMALPVPGGDAPNVISGVAFLQACNDGRLRHTSGKVLVVGGGDTSMDVAAVARRLGHIEHAREHDRPENIIMGHMAHDVATVAKRQGADVTLISRESAEIMPATKMEVTHVTQEGVKVMPGLLPVEVIVSDDGRATGVKVIRTDWSSGKMEIVEGSEAEIECSLLVAAIGQRGDLTGFEELDSGRGLIDADGFYRVKDHPNLFVGGDIVWPHLLTTAIGQASIAAEGINKFLSGADPSRRPKVDVHHFSLLDKLRETDHAPSEYPHVQDTGTDSSDFAIHNFEDRSFAEIVPSDELFLGHFKYEARYKREESTITADSVLGSFGERIQGLLEDQAQKEAARCMSCGMCFECDSCVIFCPQDAIFRVKKTDSTMGRYVDTDYTKCIGCHICEDVCPSGYIKMGMGE
ncbi:MAG: FAD-dependent oxidoreductase [Xanthomonadales bacterium]|nr:FAD-dependent oxidoreductase [Xanthomonadales bacterium]